LDGVLSSEPLDANVPPRLSNSTGNCLDAIASLQVAVTVEPGETALARLKRPFDDGNARCELPSDCRYTTGARRHCHRVGDGRRCRVAGGTPVPLR